jgi:acetate CoA/acetoacetate CoA-transferase alpha subunit
MHGLIYDRNGAINAMPSIITAEQAACLIHEGDTVMIGGFMGCGSAHTVIAAIAASGVGGLTAICNDASMPGGPDGGKYYGIAKLIHNRQIKKLIASHVGMNPEVTLLMNEGALDLTLVPQGSLAEMIRAGGSGLGGVLTPTGVGTAVQDADHVHSVVNIDGKTYLLERPLRADTAIINGYLIDRGGNIWYKGTTRNLNPVMAMAADIVIAEADRIVDIGGIEPENAVTPGILVDYIVEKGNFGFNNEQNRY